MEIKVTKLEPGDVLVISADYIDEDSISRIKEIFNSKTIVVGENVEMNVIRPSKIQQQDPVV